MKPIAHYVRSEPGVAGISVEELAKAAQLDVKLVKAIVGGHYLPSPQQRQRLAAALGFSVDDISWDHATPVEHMRGNGPQFGRST